LIPGFQFNAVFPKRFRGVCDRIMHMDLGAIAS
jgi:hypothetical protein